MQSYRKTIEQVRHENTNLQQRVDDLTQSHTQPKKSPQRANKENQKEKYNSPPGGSTKEHPYLKQLEAIKKTLELSRTKKEKEKEAEKNLHGHDEDRSMFCLLLQISLSTKFVIRAFNVTFKSFPLKICK
jgi:hypothetical protein